MVRRHLELALLRGGPLDRADVPVISGIRLVAVSGNDGLEIGRQGSSSRSRWRTPRDCPRRPRIAAPSATNFDPSVFASHLDRHARRTVLHDADLRRSAHISARSGLFLVEIHVPRRPLLAARRVEIASRTGAESSSLFELFVENAGDIAVRIRASRGSAHSQATTASPSAWNPLPAPRRRLHIVHRVSHRRRLGQEHHLAVFHLRRNLLAVGTDNAHRLWLAAGKATAASTTSSRAMLSGL